MRSTLFLTFIAISSAGCGTSAPARFDRSPVPAELVSGPLTIEEIWSEGESALPEGLSLPVRAALRSTPGHIRLFKPNGEVERDVQLPCPSGGYVSSLSADGSVAVCRSTGVIVRGVGRFATRILDVQENKILWEGETTGNEGLYLSPGGEIVFHRDYGRFGGSTVLRRPDWSLIKSTMWTAVRWNFSRKYLATLEVDLEGKDPQRTHLPGGVGKGPLYLRVYDFDGNVVLDEFLDEISTALRLDIQDDGRAAALYRTYDIYWTPVRTYGHSIFILILADVEKKRIERRWFTVERSTNDVSLARSPNGRYLALSVYVDHDVDLYDVKTILATPDTLCAPLRSAAVPESLAGRPDVEVSASNEILALSDRGIVAVEAGCTEEDQRSRRVLVWSVDGSWYPVPNTELDPDYGVRCRFFGPEDDLLVQSGELFKCFRIRSQ